MVGIRAGRARMAAGAEGLTLGASKGRATEQTRLMRFCRRYKGKCCSLSCDAWSPRHVRGISAGCRGPQVASEGRARQSAAYLSCRDLGSAGTGSRPEISSMRVEIFTNEGNDKDNLPQRILA